MAEKGHGGDNVSPLPATALVPPAAFALVLGIFSCRNVTFNGCVKGNWGAAVRPALRTYSFSARVLSSSTCDAC